MTSNVCAIVVTYNPEVDVFKNCISTYYNQVDEVIIVDNGSSKETIEEIENFEFENISILKLGDNLGIATALNKGIELAIKKDYEWVITFDHDSEIAGNMIKKMFEVYNEKLKSQPIGIIAPNYKDINTGDTSLFVLKEGPFFKRVLSSGDYIEPLFVITSGSLMKTDVFKKVGKYKDDLFIDYVDNEYCLRLQKQGYKLIVVTDAYMYHRLGEREVISRGPFRIVPTNHGFLRKYYIERNRVYTYKKYAFKNPQWFLYDIIACIYDIFRVMLFEKNRKMKCKMMAKGFYHGFINKFGKFS